MNFEKVKNTLKHYKTIADVVSLGHDWDISVDKRAECFVDLVRRLANQPEDRYSHFRKHYICGYTYENISLECYVDKNVVWRNCDKVVEELLLALKQIDLDFEEWYQTAIL